MNNPLPVKVRWLIPKGVYRYKSSERGGRNLPPPPGTSYWGVRQNLNCKFKTFDILDIRYNCNLYNNDSSFFYMFAMAVQTAESNGLNFSEETHGYPWG